MPDSVIRQSLLPLPGRRFDTSDTTECRVSQYATVRYASNEYSVRVAMASRNVTVRDNTWTLLRETAKMPATCTLSAIARKETAQYLTSKASGTGAESGFPAPIKKHKLLRKRAHGNPPDLHRRRRKSLLAQESGILSPCTARKNTGLGCCSNDWPVRLWPIDTERGEFMQDTGIKESLRCYAKLLKFPIFSDLNEEKTKYKAGESLE